MSDVASPKEPLTVHLHKVYVSRDSSPVVIVYVASSRNKQYSAKFQSEDIGSFARELLGLTRTYGGDLKLLYNDTETAASLGMIQEDGFTLGSPLEPKDIQLLAEELRKELAGKNAQPQFAISPMM